MYIQLIRNKPQGNTITGRLVIDGRWFCNTLERVGYQIPALCYHIAVTHSPKFKRLLPIVQNVPQRSGIRFHVGKAPKHSTGCILVVADNPSRSRELIRAEVVDVVVNNKNIGSRSAADIETQLTQLLFQTQESHEEIILEVFDFRPGTEYGYNHPCERELQQHEIDARRAEQRYYELHPEECKG